MVNEEALILAARILVWFTRQRPGRKCDFKLLELADNATEIVDQRRGNPGAKSLLSVLVSHLWAI